jgi:hypothetical protein
MMDPTSHIPAINNPPINIGAFAGLFLVKTDLVI